MGCLLIEWLYIERKRERITECISIFQKSSVVLLIYNMNCFLQILFLYVCNVIFISQVLRLLFAFAYRQRYNVIFIYM